MAPVHDKEGVGFEEEHRIAHANYRYPSPTIDTVSCSHTFRVDSKAETPRDIVYTTQSQLPQNLRNVFEETLAPELIAALRENLAPLNTGRATHETLLEKRHELVVSNLSTNHHDLLSGIYDIKAQIKDTQIIQQQIFTALKDPASMGESRRKNTRKLSWEAANYGEERDQASQPVEDSLREVYYLVFLYLGYFLKNLFQALTLLVRPPQGLDAHIASKVQHFIPGCPGTATPHITL